jgi:protein SCO1/2
VNRITRLLSFGAVAATLMSVSGCGGAPRELAGYRRDPAPVVAEFELPDLSNDGEPFALRARPGELLVVYFGYTNCPDFCPTTMSDVRFARQQLDDPDLVSVAMVTIDPDRDLPSTADQGLLTSVAAPFGTSFHVDTDDDGEIEVAHRTDLYAIDDQGRLVLTWAFGVSRDDLAADFRQLLEAGA